MPSQQSEAVSDRRQFLSRTAATGAGVLVGASALEALLPSLADAKRRHGVTKGDLAILGAAQIAEALAVTTYTNIIDKRPFFAGCHRMTRATSRRRARRRCPTTSSR